MTEDLKHTKFLSEEGLEKLWDMIKNGFSPRWQAYKPSNKKTSDSATVYTTDDSNDCISADQNNVTINFSSAGILTQGASVYGNDIRLVINQAEPSTNDIGGSAGLLSAPDKEKLDRLGSDIENTITIKGEKVNGTELTLTDKYTNWNLVYNSGTNTLDIVDKNKSNTVLTSVNVNDFIGEVFKDGFITDVSLVDKDDNNTSGTFIKMVFALTKTSSSSGNTEYTKTLYLNISDLIDIYTAGTGLSTSTANNSGIDNTPTSTTINLKPAATAEIGGIKVKSTNKTPSHQDLSSKANRYFSIEKDTNDFAFVNVPICDLEIIGSADPNNPDTINVSAGGKIKYVSQIESESTSTKHSINIVYDEIEIAKETSVTAVAGTNTAVENFPKHGTTFTAITEITPSGTNNHELKLNTTTFKFPKLTIDTNQTTSGQTENVPNETITAYEDEFRVLTDINYDDTNDKIIKTYADINIAIQSIPDATINGLVYPTA